MTQTVLATIKTIQAEREEKKIMPCYAMYRRDLLSCFSKKELDKALKELIEWEVIRVGRTMNDWYIEVL